MISTSWFDARLDAMVEQTLDLVRAESPSEDLQALADCARQIVRVSELTASGTPEVVVDDRRAHVVWSFGSSPRVLLLGHFDTVWPRGTLDRMPAAASNGLITGPGSFDMKSGIVIALHVLAALECPDGVTMVLTSDEEIGSASGRPLVEQHARAAEAVLVLEPSAPEGALKIARKGVTSFRVTFAGRTAHAGLEPEKGVNAVVEAGQEIFAATRLARPEIGTTVTPTIVSGGSAINVVPDAASVEIDARAETEGELQRVTDAIRDRTPETECTRAVEQLSWRPPLEAQMSAALFDRARRVGTALGLVVDGVSVGGGSDGNFTAALGVPTIDGLGTVGDGAHAAHERVEIGSLAPRAALLAGLTRNLLDEPLSTRR